MKRTPLKRRMYRTLVCAVCGESFERRADQKASKAVDGVVRCMSCSRRARVVGRTFPERRTGEERACAVCGRLFYRSASASGPLCSGGCRAAKARGQEHPERWGRSTNAGEANGRFKSGKYVGKNAGGGQKRKVRLEVRARDGDWCLLCGDPGPGLHLHRVVYGSQGGKYESSNCVLLCNSHHMRVHRSKKAWAPDLLAHLAGDQDAQSRLVIVDNALPKR